MKFSTLSKRLANHLVHMRQRRGLTQAELSRSSGVSLKYISMMEAGTNPSIKTIVRLCAALEMDLGDLVERLRSARPVVVRKRRVSPLHIEFPIDCPAFRRLVALIRTMDRDQRARALHIIREL